jgi:hypothetical protein
VAVQKKALRDAASVAAEAEMDQRQADEASSSAALQALEAELDKLVQVGGLQAGVRRAAVCTCVGCGGAGWAGAGWQGKAAACMCAGCSGSG